MVKTKNQRRKEALSNKSAVETLRFQTQWGMKQLGQGEDSMLCKLANVETDFIAELGLTQDLLSIKTLVDGVKVHLNAMPTTEAGDFVKSPTAIALGIASVDDIQRIDAPLTWSEILDRKLMKIFYPEEKRNAVVEWAKANGFNTSTYLARPIVKFKNIYVIIERTRE